MKKIILIAVCIAASRLLAEGPSQPEFLKFTPYGDFNLVDEFTGTFKYSIPVITVPGPDGSSYTLVLNYTSGGSPTEDASWVGYGWDLSPGGITRQVKGLPDDYSGDMIQVLNKTEPLQTFDFTLKGNVESFSFFSFADMGQVSFIYNNYKGFQLYASLGLETVIPYYNILNLGYGNKSAFDFLSTIGAPLLGNSLSSVEKQITNFTNSSWAKGLSYFIPTTVDKLRSTLNRSHTNFPGYTNSYNGLIIPNMEKNVQDFNLSFSAKGDMLMMTGVNLGVDMHYTKVSTPGLKSYKAYGFMYSHLFKENNTNEEIGSLMDYYHEEISPLNDRSNYVDIPFASEDHFVVNGQDISGSFKGHFTRPGLFRQNQISYGNSAAGGGLDISLGTDIAGGFTLNYGYTHLSIYNDDPVDNKFNFCNDHRNDFYFRFKNDKSDNALNYNSIDNPALNYYLRETYLTSESDVSGRRPFSSSAIRYFRKSDMWYSSYYEDIYDEMLSDNHADPADNIPPYPFNQYWKKPGGAPFDAAHLGSADYDRYGLYGTDRHFSDLRLSQFTVVNGEGKTYNYGLPVLAKDENTYSYGISDAGSLTSDGYRLFRSISPATASVVSGQERSPAYASAFLLTSVFQQNYVDRTMDGPSPDDAGGYTTFGYRRPVWSGNDRGWHKWRIPYTGLNFLKNSISDHKDDRYTVSMGKKQIYYLEKAETKTHIAVFVTNKSNYYYKLKGDETIYELEGSGTERKDGYSAARDELVASTDNEDEIATVGIGREQNQNMLERLEKIYLFQKEIKDIDDESYDPSEIPVYEKLIQVVNFEYDENYPIWAGMPNSFRNFADAEDKGGKLTLKKVWTDYQDVREARVSPYMFSYKVSEDDYDELTDASRYTDISGVYYDGTMDKDQEPAFSYTDINGWGAYENNTLADDPGCGFSAPYTKYKLLQPWVTQHRPEATDTYDPSAWYLKKIINPDGGQLNVMYEQHKYSYVQDRKAEVMCPVSDEYALLDKAISIELANVFNEDNIDDINGYVKELNRIYGDGKKPMYFKILYSLLVNASICGGVGDACLDNCNSEYFEGYFPVSSVMVDPSVSSGTAILIILMKDIPEQMCENMMTNGGKSTEKFCGNCDPNNGIIDDGQNAADIFYTVTNMLIQQIPIINASAVCDDINLQGLSYVKLPVPLYKKGGGARVKYLVFKDVFNEVNSYGIDNEIYGYEYIYQNEDGTCSGVATNEPGSHGAENALVHNMDAQSPKNIFDEFMNGSRIEFFNGPVGSSLLPAPAINYSSVFVENIYKGITNDGFRQKKYFTTKDYPFDRKYTIEEEGPDKIFSGTSASSIYNDFDMIPVNMPNYSLNTLSIEAAQSYLFITNGMNGMQKAETQYSGKYGEKNTWMKVKNTEYGYFEPGERILQMGKVNEYHKDFIGAEGNLVAEAVTVNDVNVSSKGANFDFGLFLFFFPFPVGSVTVPLSISNQSRSTFAMTKTLDFPAILKEVTTTVDGITKTQKNVAFDSRSGLAVVTSTNDEYDGQDLHSSSDHDGKYFTFNILGHNYYPELGPKSINIDRVVRTGASERMVHYRSAVPGLNDFLYMYPSEYCGELGVFFPGDIINLAFGMENYGFYRVEDVMPNFVKIHSLFDFENTFVPDAKLCSHASIVESGYENNLSASIGSFTTYGNTETNTEFSTVLPAASGFSSTYYNSVASGQLSDRNSFIAGFNAVIDDVITNGGSDDFSPTGTLLMELYSGCDDVEAFTDITIEKDAVNGLLKICYEDEQDIAFPIGSYYENHPLKNALNNWLDKTWNLNLAQEFPDFIDWDEDCVKDETADPLCDGTDLHIATQRYATRFPGNYYPDFTDKYGVYGLIDEVTGMNAILSATYYINGVALKGSDIIESEPMDCHDRGKYIMIDRAPGATTIASNDDIVYIAYSDFKFKMGEPGYESRWGGIRRQTDRYGEQVCQKENIGVGGGCYGRCDGCHPGTKACRICSDCGNYNWFPPHFVDMDIEGDPFFDQLKRFTYDAFLDLPFSADVLAPLTDETTLVFGYNEYTGADITYGDGDPLAADANNYALFDDIANNGTFTETIGRYIVEDCMLKYEVLSESLYNITGSLKIDILDLCGEIESVDPAEFPRRCCTIVDLEDIPPSTDFFVLDEAKGNQIAINPAIGIECAALCLRFCPDIYPTMEIDNVLQANSVEMTGEEYVYGYSDKYSDKYLIVQDRYRKQEEGYWRPIRDYAYMDGIDHGFNIGGKRKNYLDAGVFDEFYLFNWRSPVNNVQPEDGAYWLMNNFYEHYNMHGYPVRVRDRIGRLMSTKYYDRTNLTKASAVLASYFGFDFESFEHSAGADIMEDAAHTGTKSLKIESGMDKRIFSKISFDPPGSYAVSEIQNGVIFKAWVKDENLNFTPGPLTTPLKIVIRLNSTSAAILLTSNGDTDAFKVVAKTGEWSLCTLKVDDGILATSTLYDIELENTHGSDFILVDDVRFQSYDAQVNCYVYDLKNNNLLAEFDDQHFARLYQYNKEGKLLRKMIETEKGIKTVAENTYNRPKLKRIEDAEYTGFDPEDYKFNYPPVIEEFRQRQWHDGMAPDSKKSNNIELKHNLLDMKIDQDGIRTKLFEPGPADFDESSDDSSATMPWEKIPDIKKEVEKGMEEKEKIMESVPAIDAEKVIDEKTDGGIGEKIIKEAENRAEKEAGKIPDTDIRKKAKSQVKKKYDKLKKTK